MNDKMSIGDRLRELTNKKLIEIEAENKVKYEQKYEICEKWFTEHIEPCLIHAAELGSNECIFELDNYQELETNFKIYSKISEEEDFKIYIDDSDRCCVISW